MRTIVNYRTLEKKYIQELEQWYKFPLAIDICKYSEIFLINSDKFTLDLCISRTFKINHNDSYEMLGKLKLKKLRDTINLPLYNVELFYNNNKVGEFNFLSKVRWNNYKEEEFIEIIKKSIQNNINKSVQIKSHFSNLVRTQELITVYEQIINKTYDSSDFTVNISDAKYGGNYNVKLEMYGINSYAIYVNTNIDSKYNQSNKFIATIDILDVKTVEEFENAIINTINQTQIKNNYLNFLKSFPFLDEQINKAKSEYEFINNIIECGAKNYITEITQKIKESGYIRPNKRQKQSVGLSSGSEIKWVINSTLIKDDIYEYNKFNKNSPSFFYTVISYAVHREVNNIHSWSEFVLMESTADWIKTMQTFGCTKSRKELFDVIAIIAHDIVNNLFHEKIKNKFNFNDIFTQTKNNISIEQVFKNIAKEFGIETENVDIKTIYRQLVNKMHPDKFQDEDKKIEMTEKFKEMQAIWTKIAV